MESQRGFAATAHMYKTFSGGQVLEPRRDWKNESRWDGVVVMMADGGRIPIGVAPQHQHSLGWEA